MMWYTSVFVISETRFQRHTGRAVVAPVNESGLIPAGPLAVPVAAGIAMVDHLATIAVDRLLQRVDVASLDALLRARRAVREIAG
jgi:mRNA-degrading endonuclease toxin of MazEF toxin-antitoxin module